MGLLLRTGRHAAYRRRLQAETLAHPLVFALVAYIAAWNVAVQPRRSAAVLPLMPVLTYSAKPSRRHG
jgi:hypothetical protein